MPKNLKIAPVLICLVLLVLYIPRGQKTQPVPVLEQPEGVLTEEVPLQTLLPPLKYICACESTGSATGTPVHIRNGKVIQGKINPLDTGICQINLHYHKTDARKMGLDLWKEQDNITYANHLYRTQGSQPWNWSKSCWGKYVQ